MIKREDEMEISERAELFETFHLGAGYHKNFNDGACALELVSYVAGELWSDHPKCVCPVLGTFFRAWNDVLSDDERDATLRPFLRRLIGTNGGPSLAKRRSLMAADWLIRVHTPTWLRLAKLITQADALEALPELTSMAQIPSIRGAVDAARTDAAAAWDAARDTWDAWEARDAWDATWEAARDAGSDAWDDAVDATVSAAWDAAKDAKGVAWDVLRPTREMLIKSAGELVERMLRAAE